MSDKAHHSSNNVHDVVIHTDYGQEHGVRIAAAEFMGGQFVIPPTEALTATQSNTLTLAGLGYSAVHAPAAFGLTEYAFTKGLSEARDKIALPYEPASLLLSRGFNLGLFVTSRLASPPQAPLTPRQQEVWQGLANGETPALTAKRLFLSPNTIKAHRARLYESLDVMSGSEATLYYCLSDRQYLDTTYELDEADCTRQGLRRFVMPHPAALE